MSSDGYINIPKGYFWCDECQALTPHDQEKSPEYSWQEDYYYCKICDSQIDFNNDTNCPKCGWNYLPYYESGPKQDIQAHQPGCHYMENSIDAEDICYSLGYSHAENVWDEFIRRNFQFRNIKEIKCSCLTYEIITDPYCYASTGGYGSGMECYNDTWWHLDIRCPICGERFEIDDSSC